jgi:hypothetical protein
LRSLLRIGAGYGFKKDTPEFANCMMQIDQQRKVQLHRIKPPHKH